MDKAQPASAPGAILFFVMLATIMQALDSTIAAVALPYMQSGLSATYEQISWVLTSYIVATAIVMPLTGWFSVRFGQKRLFLTAVGCFTVASMLCGAAADIGQLVAFRILQGAFGALLIPLSQAVLLDTFPRERHAKAMAVWGMGVMVGPIIGPTLGGWLTEFYGWRWIFYVNLPVGVLTLVGLAQTLNRKERDAGLSFDWFGFAVLSIAIGALQLMLDRGEHLGWFSSREVLSEALIAVLGLYLFVVHMLTSPRAFLSPLLFKDRNFVTSLALIFMVGVLLLGSVVLLTPFVQNLMGYPVMTAGMMMAPRGMGTVVAMLVAGQLSHRVEPRVFVLAGLAMSSASFGLMSGYTHDMGATPIITVGMLQGAGLGFLFIPLATVAFSTLPAVVMTQATSLFNLLRSIGSSIGISVVVFLYGRQSGTAAVEISQSARLSPTSDPAWFDVIAAQASLLGYVNVFHAMMWVPIAAMPLVALIRSSRPDPAEPRG